MPGRCFGYADIYGEQRSMVITFSYGRKAHAVVVLIDYLLGGGIKDCYVVDYTDSLRNEYRKIGRDPDLVFSDLDRRKPARFSAGAGMPSLPAETDQVEDVEDYIDLLRGRSRCCLSRRRPAAAGGNGRAAQQASAAKRPRAPKNIHRLKVTLRGAKPPIWRRFEVPSDITLQRLHAVIQLGFGWEDSHLYVFETPLAGTASPTLTTSSTSAAPPTRSCPPLPTGPATASATSTTSVTAGSTTSSSRLSCRRSRVSRIRGARAAAAQARRRTAAASGATPTCSTSWPTRDTTTIRRGCAGLASSPPPSSTRTPSTATP